MNIENLRNFIVVVQTGNILSASKKLFISQPSLSCQMKELEKELDTTLFLRGGRKIQLTENGSVFYKRAKKIIREYDGLKTDIDDYKKGNTGTLNISIPPTVYHDLIMNHFGRFIQKYPHIKLNVFECVSERAIKLLDDGEVELAIINPIVVNTSAYNVKELISESFKIIFPENNELTKKKIIYLKDLKDQHISIPRAYLQDIQQEMKDENLSVEIDVVTSTTSSAIELAKSKKICAVVPLPDRERISTASVIRPLKLKILNHFSRKLVWLKDRELSQIAKYYLEMINESFN